MWKPTVLLAAIFCGVFGAAAWGAEGDVTLSDHPGSVMLSNGIVSFVVNKATATIPEMHLGSSPNIAGRGAYFAVANSGGHDSFDVHNAKYVVVRNTPDLVELSFGSPIGGVYFTQHYILRRGDHGFYVYVLMQRRRPGDPLENTGQIRWSFYLNPSLINYHLASDAEQGPIPDTRGSTQVQDATFRLKDGSVYTKYNYCTYIEEDDLHGECGSGPGSYGAFIINPSKEFLQAPTKQEITIHQGPIIHRMLASGHFEPRELASPSIPTGWVKLCGPWMVYLNTGDSPQQIWDEAKGQFKKEAAQWPYAWMNDPQYPLRRGQVRGTLRLYRNERPAAHALMVLGAPKPDWQIQVLNYIFSTRADEDGAFSLDHVRPGTYTLYAQIPGETDQFRRDNIVVRPDETVELGPIDFEPAYYSAKLWEIGYADLRTTGFKLADQPRQYGLDQQVPANLTYTVGRSTPRDDWYYAQAKPGDWNVVFDVDRPYAGQGVLTIGIAGQTINPRLSVLVNRVGVGVYTGGNSSAAYRSAILGSSYYESKIIRFPASLLHKGTNTMTFRLAGPRSGAVMYDVVKLEIDNPRIPKQVPVESTPP